MLFSTSLAEACSVVTNLHCLFSCFKAGKIATLVYAVRNKKNSRETNLHKNWALEGCPAYYLSEICFDSDDETNDMRPYIKKANFFYMIGIQERINKTFYSHYYTEVLLKVYFKKGIVSLHYKETKLFPQSSACPYSFCIRYNERHLAQKIDDYLEQPIIICNVQKRTQNSLLKFFPKCIAVVDGSVQRIPRPKYDQESYYIGKYGFLYVKMQVAVGLQGLTIDTKGQYQGSVNDFTILQNTNSKKKILWKQSSACFSSF